MVGDGINDAAALASSDIGIAMGEGVGAASDVSSIVLMGNRLSQVPLCLIPFNKFGGLRYLGRFEFCFSPGKYSLFFRLHLGRAFKHRGRRVYSPEHVHGWDIKLVRFQPSTSDGQTDQSKYYLEDLGSWINYLVGNFLVADADELVKVKFSMTQIDCTHTKGCLCVDPMLIYPKDLRLGKVPPFYT